MRAYLILFLCLSCYLDISAQKPIVINLARTIGKSPKEMMLSELAPILSTFHLKRLMIA